MSHFETPKVQKLRKELDNLLDDSENYIKDTNTIYMQYLKNRLIDPLTAKKKFIDSMKGLDRV